MKTELDLYDGAMHALALLDTAEARGVPREELAAASGLPLPDDPVLGATVDYRAMARALREAVARTGDEAFGLHMGERADPPKLGLLGYLTIHQPTLRDILQLSYDVLARLSNVFSVRLALNADPAQVLLHPTAPVAPMLHQMAEFHCAVFVRNTRRYVAADFRPRAVRFAHAAPADTSEHRRIFRCPLSFGAPATVLEFDAHWLDAPVPRADATLARTLQPLAEQEMERLPRHDGIRERVRAVVAGRMGGGALTLEAVALQMGFRPRTLQFRLRQEGASFREVLDAVREEAARTLLRESAQPMEVVAARLGYSETAAFHRAFRRWTGRTPQAFRSGRG